MPWLIINTVFNFLNTVHLKSRKIKPHCPSCEKTYSWCLPLTAWAFTYRGEMQIKAETVREHSQLWLLSLPFPKQAQFFLCNSAKHCLFIPTRTPVWLHMYLQSASQCGFRILSLDSFICGSRHNIEMRQDCQGTHGHTETSHFGACNNIAHRLLYPARSCSELSKMFRQADTPHTPQLLPHLLQCKPSRNNDSKFLSHFCIIQVSLRNGKP